MRTWQGSEASTTSRRTRAVRAAASAGAIAVLVAGPSLAHAGNKRPAPKADLVVKSGDLSLAKGRLVVDFTVKNTGTAKAPASTAGIATVINGKVTLLKKAPVAALKGGKSDDVTQKVTLTAALAAGSHEISVCADQLGEITEQSESNNCLDLGTYAGGKVVDAVNPVPTRKPVDVPVAKATPAPTATPFPVPPNPVILPVTTPGPTPTATPTPSPAPTPLGPQPRPTSTVPTDPLPGFPQDDVSSIGTGDAKYWIDVPPSYDASGKTPMRLLVWMHGCGGESSGEIYNVAPGDDTQNYIAIAPNGAEDSCWDVDTQPAKVWAMVADVETHFNIDRRRIVLGGYSSGGDMAYRMAFDDAYDVAGILVENTAPFSASGVTSAAIDTAYWKFNVVHLAHRSDDTYPLGDVSTQTNEMKQAGFPLTLVIKAGGHEDANTDSDMQAVLLPHMHDDWLAPAAP